MRIAIVGPTHPYKGGIAQHTTNLAHRLQRAGHDVEIVSWLRQYPDRLYPGQQRVTGDPEVELFSPTTYPLSWNRPDGWFRVGRRLKTSFDLVVLVLVTPVQGAPLTVLARTLRGGPKVVALCHNVLPHERSRVDEVLVRGVLRRVDGVLVHSDREASRAAELTSAQVQVSPLPPPHTFADQGAGSVALDVDRPATRQLLFFGLVRPYKGLDVLLRALPDVPDVRLLVAGEFWGGTESTVSLLQSLGIADRVTLRPGYVDAAEVPALFQGSDALVLPYRESTASWNGSLAHENGIPAVATRVGTMAQQLRDGVDGLLCEPEDPASLAAALRRLYEPGVLPALRRGITKPDGEGQWRDYVGALGRLASSGPA